MVRANNNKHFTLRNIKTLLALAETITESVSADEAQIITAEMQPSHQVAFRLLQKNHAQIADRFSEVVNFVFYGAATKDAPQFTDMESLRERLVTARVRLNIALENLQWDKSDINELTPIIDENYVRISTLLRFDQLATQLRRSAQGFATRNLGE